jgi:hypothetical protein
MPQSDIPESAGHEPPRSLTWRDFADTSSAVLNLLMKAALAVAIAIVVFAPQWVPILKRFSFKSSEINILGSKIEIVDLALVGGAVKLTEDGKLLIGDLDASEVPDRIAKFEQAIKNLTEENVGLKSTAQDLQALYDETKKQLDAANAKLQASAAAPVPTSALVAQARETTNRAMEQIQSSELVAAEAAKVIEQQPLALPPVGYGIVFGGDRNEQAAMDEVRKAKAETGNPIILYKRQGWWRSVAFFGSNEAAEKALPGMKELRPDSYIVDISKWCPSPVLISAETPTMAEMKDCQF